MADITVAELKKRMDAGEQLPVIDVREAWEFDEYNIGAKLIPLGELQMNLDQLPEDRSLELVIHCRSGSRSAAACSYLSGIGYSNVRNLAGGMLAWQSEIG
jgi:rhodanese-related sulfurtransferase